MIITKIKKISIVFLKILNKIGDNIEEEEEEDDEEIDMN